MRGSPTATAGSSAEAYLRDDTLGCTHALCLTDLAGMLAQHRRAIFGFGKDHTKLKSIFDQAHRMFVIAIHSLET